MKGGRLLIWLRLQKRISVQASLPPLFPSRRTIIIGAKDKAEKGIFHGRSRSQPLSLHSDQNGRSTAEQRGRGFPRRRYLEPHRSRIRRAGGQCVRHHIQHRCHPDNAAAPAADPDTPSAPCVRERSAHAGRAQCTQPPDLRGTALCGGISKAAGRHPCPACRPPAPAGGLLPALLCSLGAACGMACWPVSLQCWSSGWSAALHRSA